ncbi:MAG: DUF2341 domain-containing protein [Betaproteobacteria bacterium]
MRRVALSLAFLLLLIPGVSQAWWNADWSGRKKIELDAGTQGAALPESLALVPVLIRLHTGNFPFAEAQLEGHDLRFVADDDKTPLKFQIESFDAANELALVWVQVPKLAANASTTLWVYYGNEKAPPASDGKAVFDASHLAVLHFSEKDAAFRDTTAYGVAPAVSGVTAGVGLSDGGATYAGAGKVVFSGAPSLKTTTAGFTFSAWVKPADATQTAMLFARGSGPAAVEVRYEQGKLLARAFGAETARVDLAPGAWHHVALSVGEKVTLYVDGRAAGSAEARAADLDGDLVVGAGYSGDMDELQVAGAPRTAAWAAFQVASQGEGGKLVKVSAEAESGEGGDVSYFRILLGAVTLDGWVVIAILMVMLVISFYVMVAKSVFLARMSGANAAFKSAFGSTDDVLAVESTPEARRHSSLCRLHQTAATELGRRLESGGGQALKGKSIDAIRASLDAVTTRENASLNSQMVLLTIAISGGPFLGLLGTVVGVMITFAAIAAAGDVNVNSIAPGIAAALVATVAGLAVAIPALFGYNYLSSRIKVIAAEMQVFVDELVSRIAERYGD